LGVLNLMGSRHKALVFTNWETDLFCGVLDLVQLVKLNPIDPIFVKAKILKHLNCFCRLKVSIIVYTPRLEHTVILLLVQFTNLFEQFELFVILRLFV